MKRLIIICEGETEQTFCKTSLFPHLLAKGICIETPLIKRSRGGIVKWPVLKQEIEMHLKSSPGAVVTTFIDYYGLCSKFQFPSWEECERIPDCSLRMDTLENGMYADIRNELRHRFIPYLQLHEFEGLLFNDVDVFYNHIPSEDIVGQEELEQVLAAYDNPEMINNGQATSPSHRLVRIVKGYHKLVHGSILAEAIGLHRIRSKAPRFNNWIAKLENI